MDSQKYLQWLEKFKVKKTTDECFTPPDVYDVVRKWAVAEYDLSEWHIMRPFYPNNDYKLECYSNAVVIDNPPFSQISAIVRWFNKNGVRFFLFAPNLTLFNAAQKTCAIIVNAKVVYENNVIINTSFITNLDPACFRSAPDLKHAIESVQGKKIRNRSTYEYPRNVVTAARLNRLINAKWQVMPDQVFGPVSVLDEQKRHKKSIYGGGYLISNKAANLLEEAELEAQKHKKNFSWRLSEREKLIVLDLNWKEFKRQLEGV